GMMTCITAAFKEPEKAIAFLDFMVSPEGNDLVRLGIPGVHYTKNADGTITYNMEERTKDSFADNGWAHPLAWGSLYWPLESSYMPETELNRERALETVALATQAQKPALVNRKTSLEIENGSALDDIYNQYFVDILQGKYTVEDGAKRLSEEWRSQGGEELLVELNTVYQASK
ncbi:MAG: ABC transporter substrate-binding protein, partial [Clostridia bacterium]